MWITSEAALCVFGILVSVLLRMCTSLYPHSGQARPPMFGDYEAQRHWMEITINLPIKEWYHNTSSNDLLYWGLDYPPLTAYHSYLCGVIARFLNHQYVDLYKSRGYESEAHKLFMRYTVLCADLVLYVPAVVFYFYATRNLYRETRDDTRIKKSKTKSKSKEKATGIPVTLAIVLSLLYPGIILVDHGHFQFNCVSLGLAVFAISCICLKRNLLASFFFCLALNYKQMELYHALPFFLYLLSTCIPKPGTKVFSAVIRLSRLVLTVVITFAVIWSPFLFDFRDTAQVMHRLFPVARGVFEDKVANVWCVLNVVYKFRTRYCNLEMLRICTAATLTAVLPSSIDLFVRPNVKKFVPALINSSLAFFLFSFQVHEKTVLLAAVPVILYLPNYPIPCFWFLTVSTFSMLPLFVKDQLIIAYLSLTTFYVIAFKVIYEYSRRNVKSDNTFYMYYRTMLNIFVGIRNGGKNYSDISDVTYKHFVRNKHFLQYLLLYVSLIISLLGCSVLTVAMLILTPPVKYPDLYPLLISAYSCVHFIGFFAFFNAVQFRIPQAFDDPEYVKLKAS